VLLLSNEKISSKISSSEKFDKSVNISDFIMTNSTLNGTNIGKQNKLERSFKVLEKAFVLRILHIRMLITWTKWEFDPQSNIKYKAAFSQTLK